MKLLSIDTLEFQTEMCRAGFVRISSQLGANRDQIYFTLVPPESIPGFTDRLISSIHADLGINEIFGAFGGRLELRWDDIQ